MNCVHHFVYPMPEGEFSTGTCKKCGEIRVSRNWEPELGHIQAKKASMEKGGAATKQRWGTRSLAGPLLEDRATLTFPQLKTARNSGARCVVDGCNEYARSRERCTTHYEQLLRQERRKPEGVAGKNGRLR